MSKQYFDHIANEWDNIRQSFFSETIRESALSLACVKPGKVAADIGAGTGFITEALIRAGLKVVAVDQSEAMLSIMKDKFAGVKDINFHLGDGEKLPIPDNSVDFAFANMYLHHVESPLTAIMEMSRILKPNGRLVISDLDEHKFEFLKTEQHDRWMGFKREDIIQWYLKAGFELVFVDDVGNRCCATSKCGSKNANITVFLALGAK